MDLAGVHARHELEAAHERTERARLELVTRDLKAERDRAEAMLRAAREIATNTPVQLEAARAAERQANARYQSGLGTLIEVAEAQRLLTQAEIDDSLARLAIWRALLGVARANGDLDPVTTAAGR
jgi:outer membrane protein TolC